MENTCTRENFKKKKIVSKTPKKDKKKYNNVKFVDQLRSNFIMCPCHFHKENENAVWFLFFVFVFSHLEIKAKNNGILHSLICYFIRIPI